MKRIIVNGAKLVPGGVMIPTHVVPGGVMIPTHVVEQLRCEGVEIHHEPVGLGARRQQEIQGKAADIMILDELFGMSIVESTAVPAGELWIKQGGGVIKRVRDGKTFDTASLDRWQLPSDSHVDESIDMPGVSTAELAAFFGVPGHLTSNGRRPVDEERRISDDPSPYFNDFAG